MRVLLAVAFACAIVVACSRDYAEAVGGGCTINSDCEAPLVCAFGRCHDQCTSSRDCTLGARCVAAQYPFHVCQLDVEKACANDTDCPAGKRCAIDDQCRDACSIDRNCPGGQVCVDGTCADPNESIADGAPPRLPPWVDAGLPFVAGSSNGPIASAQVDVVTPPGVVAGDVIVAAVASDGGNIGAPPPGWSKISERNQYDLQGAVIVAAWFIRVAEAAEPPAHVFTVGASGKVASVAVAYRGIDGSAPIASSSTSIGDGKGGIVATSVTASTSGDVLVAFFFEGILGASWAAPGGMIEREDNGFIGAFDQVVGAGDTGTRTSVATPSAGNQVAALIALRFSP